MEEKAFPQESPVSPAFWSSFRGNSKTRREKHSSSPAQGCSWSYLFAFVTSQSDRYLLVASTSFTLISAASPSILSILFGRAFSKLTAYLSHLYPSPGAFHQDILPACFSIAALGAGTSLSLWCSYTLWMVVGERQQAAARTRIFCTFFTKSQSWFDTHTLVMGDLVQLNRCVEELRQGSAEAAAIILQCVASIVALVITSMYYSWALTLVTLAGTPIVAGIGIYLSRLTSRYVRKENTNTACASAMVHWNVTSATLVRLSNAQVSEKSRFSEACDACTRSFRGLNRSMASNLACFRFFALMMFIQGFWYGNLLVHSGRLTSGSVVTCLMACLQVALTTNGITDHLIHAQKAGVALTSITLFTAVEELVSPPNPATITDQVILGNLDTLLGPSSPPMGIRFTNVSFAYPARPELQVLQDVSLTFIDATLTFIVGHSGSGKSSLFLLLLGLYPSRGTIEIANVPVNAMERHELTRRVTLVEQNGSLFNDTIRNNITMTASFEPVRERCLQRACAIALVTSMVDTLPDGLDTVIGPRGEGLSGGQRQRVALARAIYKDTPVLVLDEALSALDVSLKTQVMTNLREHRAGRTTLLTTHDLESIHSEDQVVVMNKGRVAEVGRRQELEAQPGVFRRLVAKSRADPFSDAFEVVEVTPSRPAEREWSSKNKETPTVADHDLPPLGLFSILWFVCRHSQSRISLATGMVFSVVNGATNPVFSFVFAQLLAGLATSGRGVPAQTTRWFLILLAVIVVDALSTFGKTLFLDQAAETFINQTRKQTVSALLSQPALWFVRSPAEVSALLMNDTRDLRSFISSFTAALGSVTILLCISLIWALVTGWRLALVGLATLPMLVLATMLYAGLLAASETAYKTAVAEQETQAHETLEGILTIGCLGLNRYFYHGFDTCINAICYKGLRRAVLTGMGMALNNFVIYLSQAILMYYGCTLVASSAYSITTMLLTFTLTVFSLTTAGLVMGLLPDLSRGQRVGTHLIYLLGLQPSALETEGVPGLFSMFLLPVPLIEFHEVSFSYPQRPDVMVLNRLCLQVKKGETVCLAARSGSGKSTVALMMARLMDPSSGTVTLNGTALTNIKAAWLRSHIGVVTQSTIFFPGTIRDNLRYGIAGLVTPPEFQAALTRAGIWSFIESLPLGLDTVIGGALSLVVSGGQAQRLGIARALLRQPKILILDECTAALDAESTAVIAALVESLGREPDLTVVVVTHSEVMMRVATRVVVLKNGRVCEEGPFVELLAQEGELHAVLGQARGGL